MGGLARVRIYWMERVLAGLDWVSRQRVSLPWTPAHLLTGLEGEDAAYFHLRRKGYKVVARRWSAADLRGDIDLIAWHGPLLCIVEVKTRTAHDIAPAEAKVDTHKRHMLRRLARHYIKQLPHPAAPQVRFDVVSVYLVPGEEREFLHFENAFGWSEQRADWD